MILRYNSDTRRYSVEDLTSGQLRRLLTEIKNNIMEKRRHFKIRAKERTTGQIVTPEFIGYKSQNEVIAFFGLEEPDIEWYTITEVTDKKLTTPKNKNNGTMD